MTSLRVSFEERCTMTRYLLRQKPLSAPAHGPCELLHLRHELLLGMRSSRDRAHPGWRQPATILLRPLRCHSLPKPTFGRGHDPVLGQQGLAVSARDRTPLRVLDPTCGFYGEWRDHCAGCDTGNHRGSGRSYLRGVIILDV